MPSPLDLLDIALAALNHMEATVLGLKQLRKFIGDCPESLMIDALIVDAEANIAEIKRRLAQ